MGVGGRTQSWPAWLCVSCSGASCWVLCSILCSVPLPLTAQAVGGGYDHNVLLMASHYPHPIAIPSPDPIAIPSPDPIAIPSPDPSPDPNPSLILAPALPLALARVAAIVLELVGHGTRNKACTQFRT